MDNIVKLVPPIREQKPKPNPEVVAILEEWLEHAKAGEVQSVALSGITYDKCSVTGFAYNNLTTLLGATTLLQKRLLDKFE